MKETGLKGKSKKPDRSRAKNLPIVGSIVTAVVASICCIGPVVLALFSIGGAGLFSKVESFRPYLIGLTIVLLGFAFYLTYRKRKVTCEDGSCKIIRAGKWNKIALWIATPVVVFFLAFPYLVGLSRPSSVSNQSNEIAIMEVTIPVEGMTCSGCEFNVENAIKKLGGIMQVKADYQKGEVYVKFEGGKVNVDDIVEAINKTGYKAELPQ